MASAIDLKIQRNSERLYDLIIGGNGDFVTVDSFDTSIEMSLFNDQRASPSEVPVGNLRRGWWGDLVSDFQGFQIGSKLWLTRQSRLTQILLNLMQSYVTNSLQWMIDDGYATKINVSTSQSGSSGINLAIQFFRPNNIVTSKYYTLWNNSGNIS